MRSMLTKDAVATALAENQFTKYRLAKELDMASSVSVSNWLRGTRMSKAAADVFKVKFDIEVTDAYSAYKVPRDRR